MSEWVWFYAGMALCVIAALVLHLLVIAPAAPRVALERRRGPGAVDSSALSRVSQQATTAIEQTRQKRGASLFAASDLELANIPVSASSFVLLVMCAGVVLGALGLLIGGLSLLTVPLMLGFALMAPVGAKILIAVRTARRRAAFSEQLDDALSLLAGSLRAGHSLLRAIDSVSKETDPPISEELARVVNENRIGRDLTEALELTSTRMRSDDFEWVAQAIAINREVGGNLSGVFDQVGKTIRERNQIRRQIRALSAEGRLSAIILILLPIGVFAFLLITQPTYFSGFFDNILGILALVAAGILLILGSIWLMVAVRVKF